MSELYELEEIKCIKCGHDKNVSEETVVYEINEKRVGPSGENVPCEKIVTANMDNYGQGKQYYNQGGEQSYYYQQQRVGGQPVYIKGYSPAPISTAQTSRYRQGQLLQRDYSDDGFMFTESFNDRAIRNKFIQKVYTILTVQLIYTCGFIALCIFEPTVKYTITTNISLVVIAMIIFFVTYMILMCFDSARRNFPINFILLAILTMTLAFQMGFFSAIRSTEIVMMSMVITAGVCLTVSIIACQSSFDVTGCGIYLCIFGVVLMLFGTISVIVVLVSGSRIMFLIYSGLIAFLFSMYLMYDTQMIMGGRRIELSPEEYISGAITLYVDIIYILWSIMTILDACSK